MNKHHLVRFLKPESDLSYFGFVPAFAEFLFARLADTLSTTRSWIYGDYLESV
jgi:hypothetical protein